jgi:hypothetical protein
MRRVILAAAAAASVFTLSGLQQADAALITFTSPLTVDSTTATGTSFTFSGTLTAADTLRLTASGSPCLQGAVVFCTNAAGVVVTAGSEPVGGLLANASTTFGSLLLTIGGVTEQIFATNAINGLGSASPPSSLFLPETSLSALGFGPFSLVNPTLTFTVSDTTRTDNTGGFTLTGPGVGAVPESSTWVMMILGFVGIGFMAYRRKNNTAFRLA